MLRPQRTPGLGGPWVLPTVAKHQGSMEPSAGLARGRGGPQVSLAQPEGDVRLVTLGTSRGLGNPRRSHRWFRWALTRGSSSSLGEEGRAASATRKAAGLALTLTQALNSQETPCGVQTRRGAPDAETGKDAHPRTCTLPLPRALLPGPLLGKLREDAAQAATGSRGEGVPQTLSRDLFKVLFDFKSCSSLSLKIKVKSGNQREIRGEFLFKWEGTEVQGKSPSLGGGRGLREGPGALHRG